MVALRKHVSGQYFVRLRGGKSKWFGRDPIEAQNRYQSFLGILNQDHNTPDLPADRQEVRKNKKTLNVLAQEFIASKMADLAPTSKNNWTYRLSHWLNAYGNRFPSQIEARDLFSFRSILGHLKPSTANPILNHTGAFLRWLWEIGEVKEPFRTSILKPYRSVPVAPKAKSPVYINNLIKSTAAKGPAAEQTALAMLLQYYCVLRPSEVPKVVWAKEISGNVILIHAKTSNKTGSLRPVILTDEARSLIADIKWNYNHNRNLPSIQSHSGYSQACREYAKISPHCLRHSAAQALIDAGVREEYVRTAMGRHMAKVDRCYISKPNYDAVAENLKVLVEKVPMI